MKRAFTLIELMAMVSILSILASFLLPALNKAQSSSESQICSSRLRELGMAAQFYADDNADLFVISSDGWWTGIMYRGGYLEIKESVMTCPTIQPSTDDWLNGWKFNKYHKTYGVARDNKWNPRPGWEIDHVTRYSRVTLSKVESLSSFFFYADTGYHNGTTLEQRLAFTWHQRSATGAIHTRHNDKANLWFLDGHVESLDQFGLSEIGVFGGWTESQTLLDY